MNDATWEEQFTRVGRWGRRGLRWLSWRVKTRRCILVELRWRLGDELMALPALHALRAHYPQDHVTLLTHYPELLAAAGVADSINAPPTVVDRYILLRGASRLTPRQAHNARVVGLSVPMETPKLCLGALAGPLAARLPRGEGPLIALAPGASWPIKRWPASRWQELAAQLRKDGARLVGLGTGEEHVPGVHADLVDATTPLEAGQVLAAADALVCCDSGLMHLALAVGTRTVGLFGPTDPAYLTESPLLHPVLSTEECAGFWNHRAQAPPPGVCYLGHGSCLEGIRVEDVLAALRTGALH